MVEMQAQQVRGFLSDTENYNAHSAKVHICMLKQEPMYGRSILVKPCQTHTPCSKAVTRFGFRSCNLDSKPRVTSPDTQACNCSQGGSWQGNDGSTGTKGKKLCMRGLHITISMDCKMHTAA
eukprot:550514-Amphidinium_carterae.1